MQDIQLWQQAGTLANDDRGALVVWRGVQACDRTALKNPMSDFMFYIHGVSLDISHPGPLNMFIYKEEEEVFV